MMLNIGASALHSTNSAMAIVSHNIANVGTEGYSRQGLEMKSAGSNMLGGLAFGRGVETGTPQRVADQFVNRQLRDLSSEREYLDVIATQGKELDGIFGSINAGIQGAMQSFYNATSDVANDPTSAAARSVFVEQANMLAQRFNTVEDQVDVMEEAARGRLNFALNDVNRLTESLVEVNELLQAHRQVDGSARADLLDDRDKILGQLSDKLNISVYQRPDDTVSVYLQQGEGLVLEKSRATLSSTTNPYDGSLSVQLNNPLSEKIVGPSITEGEVGGLLAATNGMIAKTRNVLGLTAMGLGQRMNELNQQGIDLQGNAGGAIFSFDGPASVASSRNTGAATAATTITDFSALSADDYALRYDAGSSNWTLTNTTTDQSVTAATGPFALEGIEVTLAGGAPADGDTFFIQPTKNGIASFAVEIDRGLELAAAAPIRAESRVANTGDGVVQLQRIVDPANPNLTDEVTIEFTAANTYDVLDATGAAIATAQPYTPEQTISYNGWELSVDNAPAAGDRFSVQANADGTGDNTIVQQMAGIRDEKSFFNNTLSGSETYTNLVSSIGSQANVAQISKEAKDAAHNIMQDRRDSISGVNLDEEAANLMRLQQAYQAASKIVTTSQRVFETLISAV